MISYVHVHNLTFIIVKHVYMQLFILPDTFNTTELVMAVPVAVQEYTVLLSSNLTLVITRSVTPPVVELNTVL